MFIKVRRDTLMILLLAFLLIVCGRVITYVAYASSPEVDQGVPIAGVIVKGNDIIPIDTIRSNVESAGFRDGSFIKGNMLVTDKRELPLTDAIKNAEKFVCMSTLPGTTLQPIAAADISVDKVTGIVTVTVIEDFSTIPVSNSSNAYNSSNSSSRPNISD